MPRVTAMQPLTDAPLVQNALAGQTGSLAYFNPLTRQNELGTSVALDNGWFAMVTQSRAEAFAALDQTTAMLLVVLGAGMLVLLGAGSFWRGPSPAGWASSRGPPPGWPPATSTSR